MLAQEEARRLGHNFVGTEQVREESIERANGLRIRGARDEEGGVGGETRDATLGLSEEARRARGTRGGVADARNARAAREDAREG